MKADRHCFNKPADRFAAQHGDRKKRVSRLRHNSKIRCKAIAIKGRRLSIIACALLSMLASVSVYAHPKRLVLAHAELQGSIADIVANEFAHRINAILAGQYEVIVQRGPGSEEEILDLVRKGKITFCLPYPALVKDMPAFGAFKLPYLVLTRKHIREVRAQAARNTVGA